MSVGSATDNTGRIFRDWNEVAYIEAVVALVVAFVLVFLVKFIVPKLASWLPDRIRLWILPWVPVLRMVILVGTVVYITPIFIEPTAENIVTIGGATALALGFAFKDYASSLIAGVVALYERPYRPGDWVRIDDTYGEVQELGLRAVEVLTPDDTRVSIPHSKIWHSAIHNSNDGKLDLMCVAHFYLHPEHDGDQVTEALRDIAWTSPYLHLERPVLVVAQEEPWGTHYRLKAYPVEGRDQFQFVTDLTLRGKARLSRLGIRPCTVGAYLPGAVA